MNLNTLKPAVENTNAQVARSGLRVLDMRRGYVKCLLPIDGNGGKDGTVPKEMLKVLMEAPGNAIFLGSFNTDRFETSIKDVDLRLLKPADSDVTVELSLKEAVISRITAEVEIKGWSEFVLEGSLKDEDDNIIARYRGTYEMRPLLGVRAGVAA